MYRVEAHYGSRCGIENFIFLVRASTVDEAIEKATEAVQKENKMLVNADKFEYSVHLEDITTSGVLTVVHDTVTF